MLFALKTHFQEATAMATPENRGADIARTADALARIARQKYLKDKIGPNAPFFIRALVTANATNMSSNAFRQLFTLLTYANDDGSNAFPEHQTVADVTGYSIATSERATKELTALGWLDTQRTRRGPAFRTVMIPLPQEPSPVMVQKSRTFDSSKFLNPHPCGSRTLTREGLPTTVTYGRALEGGSYLSIGGAAAELHGKLGAVSIPRRKQAVSEAWA
jgi:hypothetical protein